MFGNKKEKKQDMANVSDPTPSGGAVMGMAPDGYIYYYTDSYGRIIPYSGSGGVVPVRLDPPKPAFDPKMETIVEPIVGWRKWKASLWDDTIASISAGTVWPVKEPLKAKCNIQGRYKVSWAVGSIEVCLGIRCTCGVYAFRTEEKVLAEFPNGPSVRDPAGAKAEPEMFNIIGEVSLWGRVIECEHGYRAQYAYPKSFRNNGTIAAKLAEVYGVKLI